ncbi:MAG: NifU family protein [Spirochaetales bacterium]|nr:NifU family protein [Spirochaetales bacterium]
MSDLKERVSQALEEVRPSLQADGGDIRFVEITDENIVKVELQGACNGCPMAQMTLKQGVENYLKKVVPEISSVENI